MDSAVGLSASMQPHLITGKRRKNKVFEIRIPGFGRIGYTRDIGEAKMFQNVMLQTSLGAIVREPDGRIIEEHDFGSGLITNVGVLALAQDGLGLKQGAAKSSFGLFPNLKWHAWGTSETAASVLDLSLNTLAAPTTTKAAAATNTLTANGEGKPKLVSTATITAEGTLKITEWGIHTGELLSAITGTPLTAESAVSGTVTATPLTASSEEVLGERLHVLVAAENAAKEAKPVWGLVTANTTSVVTVPAWYSASAGAVAVPYEKSAYTIKPVMFDHRVFGLITVEVGNKIEFPWELEVKSGG